MYYMSIVIINSIHYCVVYKLLHHLSFTQGIAIYCLLAMTILTAYRNFIVIVYWKIHVVDDYSKFPGFTGSSISM